MKTIVSPLGFHTDQIISFLMEEGISKGDKIVVLRPEEDDYETKGEEAFKKVQDFAEKISKNVEVECTILDTQEFNGLLTDISEIISEVEGEVVVNLSGGVRSILVALTVNTVFHGEKIERVYNFEEIERKTKQVDIPYIPVELKENEKKILKTVKSEGPVTYKELSKQTGLSKSTISRLCKELEGKNILGLEMDGRNKKARTTTGTFLISLT